MIVHYNTSNFTRDVNILVENIKEHITHNRSEEGRYYDFIFGVPRGGTALAVALSTRLNIPLADDVTGAYNYLIVDDVIDSGATRKKYGHHDFTCLHIKMNAPDLDRIVGATFIAGLERTSDWIEYFWEKNEAPAEDAIIRLIQAIGDNPKREGMLDTPARVIKSWQQLFCGYQGDPKERAKEMMTQFSSDGYNELVLLKDIEFFSFCEHHMLPFFGKAHIAYIPKEKVVGISKLARLLDLHSRRFQLQERIGELVTKDIMTYLDAEGAACIIEAQHLCMKMRGVSKQHSVMTTSSIKGAFLNKPAARAELMSLLK